MAESLAEKLKRLAAEKKAAAVTGTPAATAASISTAAVTQAAPAVITDDQPMGEGNADDKGNNVTSPGTGTDRIEGAEVKPDSSSGKGTELGSTVELHSEAVRVSTGTEPQTSGQVAGADLKLTPTPSSHPLAMQFAEMESALLTADPTFKTILRDVHRHLGKDPDLVTLMTEAEVALVVKGLVVFANAEVVEPAKAKAVKAAAKTMKNISADDL
jgi:hypothetical protein